MKYVSIDNYFCEKCLEEKSTKKEVTIMDHETYKLPDWAVTITYRIPGYE